MPRWDLQCDKCHKVMENVEFANAAERDECLRDLVHWGHHELGFCGGIIRVMPPAPNFKLVGKGFHVNDYPKGRK